MKKLLLSAIAVVLLIPIYTTCVGLNPQLLDQEYLNMCLRNAKTEKQKLTCYNNMRMRPPIGLYK